MCEAELYLLGCARACLVNVVASRENTPREIEPSSGVTLPETASSSPHLRAASILDRAEFPPQLGTPAAAWACRPDPADELATPPALVRAVLGGVEAMGLLEEAVDQHQSGHRAQSAQRRPEKHRGDGLRVQKEGE